MVNHVLFGGHPILVVGCILVVAIVLTGIDLRRASVVWCSLSTVPARRQFAEEIIEQVRHIELEAKKADAGKNTG